MAMKKTITKKVLPKAQKGKTVSGMYDFQNIHTGPNSTHPGVLKAKADKKKADANLAAYKKRVEAQKKAGKKPVMQNGGAKKSVSKTKIEEPKYSTKYQSTSNETYSKAYKTTPEGKVISRSIASYPARTIGGRETTSYPESTTVLDTTGYSKGKSSFPAKKTTYNVAQINYDFDPSDPNSRVGRTTYNEWDVPRSQVKKTISEMKSNSGANRSKGTNVNYSSSGTKTVVHTGSDGKKYVKVRTADGKTYNKTMKKGGVIKKKKK